jgi:hypothetical protein
MSEQSTGITVREETGLAPAPVVPATDVKSLMQMAATLHASGMLPRGIKSPQAAFAIIVTGQELGIPAMTALRSIHMVEGKPTLDAGLMLGLANQRGVQHEWLSNGENGTARIQLTAAGKAPYVHTFTVEDAKNAGLLGKDVWKKYQPAMLRARCASAAIRAFAPSLLVGVYTPEELDGPAEFVQIKVGENNNDSFDFDTAVMSIGLSAPTVRDFLQSVGAPDPDAPGNGPRLIRRLSSDEGRAAYEKWLGEQTPANNNDDGGESNVDNVA